MNILGMLLRISFKDWLIFATLVILVIALLQIRKLKKSLVQEVHKRLVPELMLELDLKEIGLFIKNESTMIAKEISIQDVDVDIEDFGYTMYFTLKFDIIEILRPNERIKLNFKAIHRGKEGPVRTPEGIIPHLTSASFRLIIDFYNIENLKFRAEFIRKLNKFVLDKLDAVQ